MINLCDTSNYILIFKYPLTDVPCNNQERLSLKFKSTSTTNKQLKQLKLQPWSKRLGTLEEIRHKEALC